MFLLKMMTNIYIPLQLRNLDFSSYYNPIIKGSSMTSNDERPVVLQFKDTTFEYDMINNDEDVQTTTFRLENVNMEVKKVKQI